jgi:hypothetical protein
MPTSEFNVVEVSDDHAHLRDALNGFARDGWEIVSVLYKASPGVDSEPATGSFVVVAKRAASA